MRVMWHCCKSLVTLLKLAPIHPNATTLQSVTFTNPSSSNNAAATFNFTPTTTFTFLADTRYWLLVDATADNYAWLRSNNSSSSPTGISGIANNGFQFSPNNGASYSFLGGNTPIFGINATEVTAVPFEFSPVGDIAILGGLWLGSKILKKKSK